MFWQVIKRLADSSPVQQAAIKAIKALLDVLNPIEVAVLLLEQLKSSADPVVKQINTQVLTELLSSDRLSGRLFLEMCRQSIALLGSDQKSLRQVGAVFMVNAIPAMRRLSLPSRIELQKRLEDTASLEARMVCHLEPCKKPVRLLSIVSLVYAQDCAAQEAKGDAYAHF